MVTKRNPGPWYSFRNSDTDSGTDLGPVDVLIYDEIDPYWGVTAADFVRDLAALDASRAINVRINSPGGDVYEGIAIANALRARDGAVTTYVDGYAASIASVVAMAGDDVVMMPNAELMIHDAWSMVRGNAADMTKAADNLNRVSDNIASVYARRAGGTVADWRAVMQSETWFSAQEAVDAGLASSISESDAPMALARNDFDLSVYNFAGRAHAPAPVVKSSSVTAEAEATQRESEASMATLKEALIERLGLDAEATDEAIIEAAAAAPTEGDDVEPAPTEPTVEQAQQVAAKHGLTIVDKGALDALAADAAAGREARARQLREDDERIVDAAVRDGRIPPARRDHWLASLSADRDGIAAVINALPKVINVDTEIGHGISGQLGSNPSSSSDDVWNALGLNKLGSEGVANV